MADQAWTDARDLEYLRIDSALRNRMNYTLFRNPYEVALKPQVLFTVTELACDIWDCIRPFYRGKERKLVDQEINWLRQEALLLFEYWRIKNEHSDIMFNDDEITRLTNFFGHEHDLYGVLMDLRHKKGLDIGFKKVIDYAQEAQAGELATYGEIKEGNNDF